METKKDYDLFYFEKSFMFDQKRVSLKAGFDEN